jgi:hypothetical protein
LTKAILIGLLVFLACFMVGGIFGMLLGSVEVLAALGVAVAAGVFAYRRITAVHAHS